MNNILPQNNANIQVLQPQLERKVGKKNINQSGKNPLSHKGQDAQEAIHAKISLLTRGGEVGGKLGPYVENIPHQAGNSQKYDSMTHLIKDHSKIISPPKFPRKVGRRAKSMARQRNSKQGVTFEFHHGPTVPTARRGVNRNPAQVSTSRRHKLKPQ